MAGDLIRIGLQKPSKKNYKTFSYPKILIKKAKIAKKIYTDLKQRTYKIYTNLFQRI